MAAGDALARWFDDVLEGATFGSVRRTATNGGPPEWRLKLIAVDVTLRRLLALPDDLVFYKEPGSSTLIDPDHFKISRGARMSMSIPYFFDPIRLESSAGGTSLIVDGGALSDSPVWLFDVHPAVAGTAPRPPAFVV